MTKATASPVPSDDVLQLFKAVAGGAPTPVAGAIIADRTQAEAERQRLAAEQQIKTDDEQMRKFNAAMDAATKLVAEGHANDAVPKVGIALKAINGVSDTVKEKMESDLVKLRMAAADSAAGYAEDANWFRMMDPMLLVNSLAFLNLSPEQQEGIEERLLQVRDAVLKGAAKLAGESFPLDVQPALDLSDKFEDTLSPEKRGGTEKLLMDVFNASVNNAAVQVEQGNIDVVNHLLLNAQKVAERLSGREQELCAGFKKVATAAATGARSRAQGSSVLADEQIKIAKSAQTLAQTFSSGLIPP